MAENLRAWLQERIGQHCDKTSATWPAWQDVLKLHPRWGSRLDDIIKARVRTSRLNGSPELQISINQRWFTISWLACVQPTLYTRRDSLKVAMRSSIYDQIRRFRSTQNNQLCERCSSVSNIQVDHVIPLNTLIQSFQESINVPAPASFTYVRRTHAVTLPPGKYRKLWREFHDKYAQLQFLCKTCNLRKGTC